MKWAGRRHRGLRLPPPIPADPGTRVARIQRDVASTRIQTMRGLVAQSSNRKEVMVSILWIILIVVLVLALLGVLGRGRF